MAFLHLLKKSIVGWHKDRASHLAASTAYYTLFSLAPLLIIVLAVTGLVLGETEVEAELMHEVKALVGSQGADAIQTMINGAQRSTQTPLASILGFIVLFLGASGLLASLQDSMNTIWKVETKPHANTIVVILLKRLFSLGMILTLGFLLLVSLLLSAAVGIAVAMLSRQVPGVAIALPVINILVSFVIITLLFTIFFTYLPDIRLRWRYALPGAMLTSLLFTIGKVAFGMYLGQRDFTSTYGVAASIIVLLLWINYSSQAMFLGVEFTKAFVESQGIAIEPRPYAQFRADRPAELARRSVVRGAIRSLFRKIGSLGRRKR